MDRPILFNAEMVRAILAGRKTQTRRIIKIQPEDDCYYQTSLKGSMFTIDYNQGNQNPFTFCPYGKVGDELWVRETYGIHENMIVFRADCEEDFRPKNGWKPSIFMPFSISRIRLTIKNIRVEQLNDISEDDAKAEGIRTKLYGSHPYFCTIDYYHADKHKKAKKNSEEYRNFEPGFCGDTGSQFRSSYESLWNLINGKDSWDKNPWVWVIDFDWKLIEKEVNND